MKRAIKDVLNRKMSENTAAERYEFPCTSLKYRVKAVTQCQHIILKPIQAVFNKHVLLNMKVNCVRTLIDLDKRLMPLTRSECLRFAYDLTEKKQYRSQA